MYSVYYILNVCTSKCTDFKYISCVVIPKINGTFNVSLNFCTRVPKVVPSNIEWFIQYSFNTVCFQYIF